MHPGASPSGRLPFWEVLRETPITSVAQPDVVSETIDLPNASSVSWADLSEGLPEWVRQQTHIPDSEQMAQEIARVDMGKLTLRHDSRIAPPLTEVPEAVQALAARVVQVKEELGVRAPVAAPIPRQKVARQSVEEPMPTNKVEPAPKHELEDVQVVPTQQEKMTTVAQSTKTLLHDLIEQDEYDRRGQQWWEPTESGLQSLSKIAMEKVEHMLKKLISLGSTNELNDDAILRLQKILERSLDVEISSSYEDIIQSNDVNSMTTVALSLRATSLTLLLFVFRPNAQLMSEQVISKAILTLDAVFDRFIQPSSKGSARGVNPDTKSAFMQIPQEFERAAELLLSYLCKDQLPEALVVRAVYMAFGILSVETIDDPAECLTGATNVERIRSLGLELILILYSHYPQQDDIFMEQLMESFQKARTDKHSRQYRVKDHTVHILSVLAARLVQLTPSRGGSGSGGEGDQQGIETAQAEDASNRTSSTGRTLALQESYSCMRMKTVKLAKIIVFRLLASAEGEAKSASKTEYHSARALFDKMVEDWSNMKYLIEFPAVPMILLELVQLLINETHRKESQASVMALEALSNILSDHFRSGNLEYIDGTSPSNLQHILEVLRDVFLAQRNWSETARAAEVTAFLRMDAAVKLLPLVVDNEDSETAAVILRLTDPAGLSEQNGFTSKSEKGDTAYMEYLRMHDLLQANDLILNTVLQCVSDTRANVKRKALSVLSFLADDHAELFAKSSMLFQLQKIVRSGQTIVKDAALELLSKFLTIKFEDDDLATKAFRIVSNTVCECASDKALSVRKRAIRLAPVITKNLENLELSGGVIYSLLLRDQDDDPGVQDLGRKTLTGILFDAQREITAPFVLDVAKILTAIQAKLTKEHVNQRDDHLRAFLFKAIGPKCELQVAEVARKMVKIAMINKILAPFEDLDDDLITLLDLIAVFVRSNAGLISQEEIVGLADRFIKVSATGHLERAARHHTFVILRSALAKSVLISNQFLAGLCTSLHKLMTKVPPNDLAEMVPVYWSAAQQSGNTVPVARLLQAVLKGMRTESESQKLIRMISIAGNIARYTNLEEHAKLFAGMDTEVNATSIVDLVIRSISKFTKEPGTPMSFAAISNMGAICVMHPKHFANPVVKNLFQRVLLARDEAANADKAKLMDSINEYLTFESDVANTALVQRSEKAGQLETHVLHGSGTAKPDDAAVKTLLELIFKDIVNFALGFNAGLAEKATLLLARSLEQGLLSPLKLIHTLICLEMSSNDYVSRVATTTHEKLHQTRESKIESFYVDGLQFAGEYKKRIRVQQLAEGTCTEGGADKNPLGPLYGIVNQMKKSQRRVFWVKLCRSVAFEPDHGSVADVLKHLDYVVFMVRSLSLLPFALQDEVLMVLYGIDSVYHAASPVIVHGIERAGDDIATWQRYGLASAILLLLWALRGHLRELYKITDAMCMEFTPRTSQLKTEARRPKLATPLDVSFDDYLITSPSERPLEWYQKVGREFSELTLKEDVSGALFDEAELDESRITDDGDDDDDEGQSSQRPSKRRKN